MKIQINSPVKLQVTCRKLKNNPGAQIDIYFFDGERYEHDATLSSYGSGSAVIGLQDWEGNSKGYINLIAETPEEEAFFNPGYDNWTSRNKETVYFLFVPNSVTEVELSLFHYERNF